MWERSVFLTVKRFFRIWKNTTMALYHTCLPHCVSILFKDHCQCIVSYHKVERQPHTNHLILVIVPTQRLSNKLATHACQKIPTGEVDKTAWKLILCKCQKFKGDGGLQFISLYFRVSNCMKDRCQVKIFSKDMHFSFIFQVPHISSLAKLTIGTLFSTSSYYYYWGNYKL